MSASVRSCVRVVGGRLVSGHDAGGRVGVVAGSDQSVDHERPRRWRGRFADIFHEGHAAAVGRFEGGLVVADPRAPVAVRAPRHRVEHEPRVALAGQIEVGLKVAADGGGAAIRTRATGRSRSRVDRSRARKSVPSRRRRRSGTGRHRVGAAPHVGTSEPPAGRLRRSRAACDLRTSTDSSAEDAAAGDQRRGGHVAYLGEERSPADGCSPQNPPGGTRTTRPGLGIAPSRSTSVQHDAASDPAVLA